MSNNSGSSTRTGFGIGSIVAAVLSYMKWHSILWAAVHALCGWFYVIYYVIRFGWR